MSADQSGRLRSLGTRLRRWWIGPTQDEMLRDLIAADRRRTAELRELAERLEKRDAER